VFFSTCKNLVELNLSNCHILEAGSFSGRSAHTLRVIWNLSANALDSRDKERSN
jgi:hypothetical protein